MSNASNDSKLSSNFAFLFAIASVVVGIGAAYALAGFGEKVVAGAYFGLVGIGGFLATYLTKARIGKGILAFFVGAGTAAAAYYLLISKLFGAAKEAVSANATTAADLAAAQGVQEVGNTFGLMIAVVVFVTTFIAGTIGVVVGAKSRGQGHAAAAGNLAKSLG